MTVGPPLQSAVKDDQTLPVMSVAPVLLPARGRGTPLQVRVSAPVTGDKLPVIVFSHGNGQSFRAYGPLADHWAAQGFAVVQPTHLDSRTLALAKDDPRRPLLWRHRETDLVTVLDQLERLHEIVPAIAGRLDVGRVAVAGHSWGALAAATLLGATHPDPTSGGAVSIKDSRVCVGVLLAVPGTGGVNLSPFAAANFPFMNLDFSAMTPPTLVVTGDRVSTGMTIRGPDWWREAFDLSPGPKALFTTFGGEHSLGGIVGYEARETTDERPERILAIQRVSTAYLRSALCPGDEAWRNMVARPDLLSKAEGRIELK